MEYLLGLLTGLVLFLCVLIGFYFGQKQPKRKVEHKPISDTEKQQIERFNKHFKELFSYDVDKALQRKKVR